MRTCLHCSISDEKSTDLRNPLISLISCTITSKCQTITVNKGHHIKGHDHYSRDTVVNKGHHSEQETPQQSRETTANKEQYSHQGAS